MINYVTRERVMTKEGLRDECKHIDMLNEALGDIELTKAEESSLQWLAGWETSTIKHIISAFEKAKNDKR